MVRIMVQGEVKEQVDLGKLAGSIKKEVSLVCHFAPSARMLRVCTSQATPLGTKSSLHLFQRACDTSIFAQFQAATFSEAMTESLAEAEKEFQAGEAEVSNDGPRSHR